MKTRHESITSVTCGYWRQLTHLLILAIATLPLIRSMREGLDITSPLNIYNLKIYHQHNLLLEKKSFLKRKPLARKWQTEILSIITESKMSRHEIPTTSTRYGSLFTMSAGFLVALFFSMIETSSGLTWTNCGGDKIQFTSFN